MSYSTIYNSSINFFDLINPFKIFLLNFVFYALHISIISLGT